MELMNWNYVMDHIQCQTFKIILSIIKKYETPTGNPPIGVYIKKI